MSLNKAFDASANKVFQASLNKARGISPSGDPETATDTDYLRFVHFHITTFFADNSNDVYNFTTTGTTSSKFCKAGLAEWVASFLSDTNDKMGFARLGLIAQAGFVATSEDDTLATRQWQDQTTAEPTWVPDGFGFSFFDPVTGPTVTIVGNQIKIAHSFIVYEEIAAWTEFPIGAYLFMGEWDDISGEPIASVLFDDLLPDPSPQRWDQFEWAYELVLEINA